MKNLIIIGAGGFGREVLSWARQCLEYGKLWHCKGFLDDNPAALNRFETGLPILGSPGSYVPQPNDVFICAIGKPAPRRTCVTAISRAGGVFINVIHPTVAIAERVQLGTGLILFPYTVISCDTVIGDHSALYYHCSVGHDARIGAFCQLSSYCDVTGNVHLEDGVFMGSHASILPSIHVEAGATIGAGSVVIRRVKAHQTVFGVPAKFL